MPALIGNHITHIDKMMLGPWETNAYIIICHRTGQSLVIDAPAEAPVIIEALKQTQPKYILLTHDHHDHTGVLVSLRSRLRVPLAAHEADSRQLETPPEILLNGGEFLELGNLKVEVIHTPGHTPGSLCFKIGKYLFAGDTIFPGGPGRTDSAEAFREILTSITEKILVLPGDTLILPGHGDGITVNKAKKEYAIFASRPHPPDLSGDVLWLSGQ